MTAGVTTTGADPAAAAARAAARDRSSIANNFDQFLLLLTTQLKAQNPLDPLDTNQFTQQLVQFASVEQQIKTNDVLGKLLSSTRAANVSTASTFLGRRVESAGREAQLRDGRAEWSLTAPRAAQRAVIEIIDQNGSIVATDRRALTAGRQAFVWDGRTSTGQQAPDGAYRIRVNALDAAGQPISVATTFSGVVDALDLSGDDPVLIVGSVRVPLGQVTGVR